MPGKPCSFRGQELELLSLLGSLWSWQLAWAVGAKMSGNYLGEVKACGKNHLVDMGALEPFDIRPRMDTLGMKCPLF